METELEAFPHISSPLIGAIYGKVGYALEMIIFKNHYYFKFFNPKLIYSNDLIPHICTYPCKHHPANPHFHFGFPFLQIPKEIISCTPPISHWISQSHP